MKTFYFTATGNSLYVAKKIGGELLSIPRMIKEKRFDFKDESIGFVFPCHFFGLPRIVEDFILKSKFKADYFFAVMTYGNISTNALDYIKKVAAVSGIKFNYTNEILMIDNYLPLFDMEKQLADEDKKNIEPNIYLIEGDVKLRKNYHKEKSVLFNIISKPANIYKKKKIRTDIDKNFIVDKDCNHCGICTKVCPNKNIELKEKSTYLHKCDYCMSCIQLCPKNAIHLKKEKSRARFKNYNITVNEIISSNNQY